VIIYRNLELSYLKVTDTVAPAQAKFHNVALIIKYSYSVALALKRLNTPGID